MEDFITLQAWFGYNRKAIVVQQRPLFREKYYVMIDDLPVAEVSGRYGPKGRILDAIYYPHCTLCPDDFEVIFDAIRGTFHKRPGFKYRFQGWD